MAKNKRKNILLKQKKETKKKELIMIRKLIVKYNHKIPLHLWKFKMEQKSFINHI